MIPQALDSRHIGSKLLLRERARDAQPRDVSDILRSGAAPSLLAGPVNQRMNRSIPPDVERADSFWSINLVADDGQQINAKWIHLDRNLAKGLRGVRMKNGAAGVRYSRELGNRLHDARFVIRVHDRH